MRSKSQIGSHTIGKGTDILPYILPYIASSFLSHPDPLASHSETKYIGVGKSGSYIRATRSRLPWGFQCRRKRLVVLITIVFVFTSREGGDIVFGRYNFEFKARDAAPSLPGLT